MWRLSERGQSSETNLKVIYPMRAKLWKEKDKRKETDGKRVIQLKCKTISALKNIHSYIYTIYLTGSENIEI